MAVRFNVPPGWPAPPESWLPHEDWMPDPNWPTPPRGWTFWTVAEQEAQPATRSGLTAYGTDRGSWLASLRARAASGVSQPGAARASADTTAHTTTDTTADTPAEPSAEVGPETGASGGEWALDGLLTSVGRVEP